MSLKTKGVCDFLEYFYIDYTKKFQDITHTVAADFFLMVFSFLFCYTSIWQIINLHSFWLLIVNFPGEKLYVKQRILILL